MVLLRCYGDYRLHDRRLADVSVRLAAWQATPYPQTWGETNGVALPLFCTLGFLGGCVPRDAASAISCRPVLAYSRSNPLPKGKICHCSGERPGREVHAVGFSGITLWQASSHSCRWILQIVASLATHRSVDCWQLQNMFIANCDVLATE